MSRLPSEHLFILVSRSGLITLGTPQRTIPLPLTDTPLDEALSALFGQTLTELKPKTVEIVISSTLVDMIVLPGLEHWLKDADLQAYSRARLAAVHGSNQNDRTIFVDRENYGIPALAASFPTRLGEQLQAECHARKIRLLGLQPLATWMIKVLPKPQNDPAPTAVWFEEPDIAWIGLHAEGTWRSVRNIPASMLQRTNRADLLLRECLAVGLASVRRIYSGHVGCSPISDFGQPSIDCSKQLVDPLPRGTNAYGCSGRSRHFYGWTVLSAALLATAITAYVWVDQQSTYAKASEMLSEQQQIRKQIDEIKRVANAAQQTSYSAAITAYRRQQLPWNALLDAINQSASGKIELTVFKVDAIDSLITLEGTANRFEELQALTDALRTHPQLSKMRISSMTREIDTQAMRVKFSMTANWKPAQDNEKKGGG